MTCGCYSFQDVLLGVVHISFLVGQKRGALLLFLLKLQAAIDDGVTKDTKNGEREFAANADEMQLWMLIHSIGPGWW